MESLDELLDFASDIGEEEDDMQTNKNRTKSLKHLSSSSTVAKTSGIVEEEEELEWISNKDAFPKFESFVDISPKELNHSNKQSPVSVLENITDSNRINSLKVPVRARSKRRREQWQEYSWWWAIVNNSKIKKRGNNKPMKSESSSSSSSSSLVVLGRKCQHCQTEKTPQWRAGPTGPKTLCNACGVRYKSGRLVPEYRPASSPTFSTDLHSNSHRKVLEMRKLKQITEPP